MKPMESIVHAFHCGDNLRRRWLRSKSRNLASQTIARPVQPRHPVRQSRQVSSTSSLASTLTSWRGGDGSHFGGGHCRASVAVVACRRAAAEEKRAT
jgi:hypothetical protein